jgi:hypothetical protein
MPRPRSARRGAGGAAGGHFQALLNGIVGIEELAGIAEGIGGDI